MSARQSEAIGHTPSRSVAALDLGAPRSDLRSLGVVVGHLALVFSPMYLAAALGRDVPRLVGAFRCIGR